jgi:hypothetical protein
VVKNDHLFLILTRRWNPQTRTYGAFHWVSHYGPEPYPPRELCTYEDDAGIVQEAIVWYVGEVLFTPYHYHEEAVCKALLGESNLSSVEAFQKTQNAYGVTIIMGLPRHRPAI